MRFRTSLRRLAGLAIVSLRGDRAGAGTRPTAAARSTRETNASANAVQAFDAGRRRHAHAGRELPHRRRRQRRGRPRLAGRARPRSRLAARGQRRLERRLGLPRARRSARARQSRALGRHDAQQRHARRRRRLRAQQRRHRQHQRLQARPPRPRAAARRDAAARRSATAGAVQVSFTPRGDQLVVSEKGANTIDTYPVDRWGRAGAGTAHASAGAAPFGFAFGKHDCPQRDRGGRERAHVVPARSVHDDHGLAPERPGRGLLGRLDEQRALSSHGQCGDRLHLRLLAVAGTAAHAAHARAARRPSWPPARTRWTRRSRVTASSTSTAATPARSTRSRSAGNGSLTSLGGVGALPAGFGGLVVSS